MALLQLLCACCALSLGLAHPMGQADISALVQTVVGAHVQDSAVGVPELSQGAQLEFAKAEANFTEGRDALGRAAIRAGDNMEVIVLKGLKAGSWLKCKVIGAGKEPGTYDVFVPSAPAKRRTIEGVPFTALRRPAVEEGKTDGVLLFWAVSSKDYNMDLLRKNVDHLRSSYAGKADVFLVHIDGEKNAWLEKDEPWYKQNVQYSEERSVPKRNLAASSMLFASAYYPPQLKLAKQYLPELLSKRQYEYVWLVDEDLDFSGTNLTQLFADARSSDALILTPSVKYEDRTPRRKAMEKLYLTGCAPGMGTCFNFMPKPNCQFRYTNFVQALFPLMKPDAFVEMAACEECEDGIDRIWCSRTARQLQHVREQACAILDRATVVHTNSKTQRKWDAVEQGHDLSGAVSSLHGADWVPPGDLDEFDCVH